MGPCDDSEVSRAEKPEGSLEIMDYEARENIDENSLSSVNESLKNCSSGDGKDSTLKDKSNKMNSFSQACDEVDDEGNLFKLSVRFVRGNPFDSLKHWRMRCGFLEANLRINSLGRIREVNEEILNISKKELGDGYQGEVRLIQVKTRHGEELQETVQAKHVKSGVLNELSPEGRSRKCTVSDGLERKESDLTSLKLIACEKAVVDETKSTKDSLTSLADAACEQDERKTFSNNSCPSENTRQPALGWQSVDRTPTKSSLQEDEYSDSDQTRSIERPGLFTKILRRIIAVIQGRKNDVWPAENSQRRSTTIPQSSV